MADGSSSSSASQQNGEIRQVTIEMTPAPNNMSLANSIGETLQNASVSHNRRGNCCIYRIDADYRGTKWRMFNPEIVSIGPFHREGTDILRGMDALKKRYREALLSRIRNSESETILAECVGSLRVVERKARECYSEDIPLSSDDFISTMLHDGLFIIELFLKNAAGKAEKDTTDPLFGKLCTLITLTRDLLLLENQIPMLVLDCLFNLPALKEGLQSSRSISMLALLFFNRLMPRDNEVLEKYSRFEGKHLLDLLAKTFHVLPGREISINKSIPSATELEQIGVKFKKVSQEGNFLDINFTGGVLEFPPVLIHDQTKSLLGNLIAFEHYSGGDVTYVTSYVLFMKCILDSPSDVAMLMICSI